MINGTVVATSLTTLPTYWHPSKLVVVDVALLYALSDDLLWDVDAKQKENIISNPNLSPSYGNT